MPRHTQEIGEEIVDRERLLDGWMIDDDDDDLCFQLREERMEIGGVRSG